MNLRDLREVVRQTWDRMRKYRVDMTAVGGQSSNIGTRWIILDLLREDHIRKIIEQSTNAQLLSPQVAQWDKLPGALQQWTGGSPPLLVYALGVVHLLLEQGEQFDAEETMAEVYRIFFSHWIKWQVRSSSLRRMRRVGVAQLWVPCTRKMTLPVGGKEYTMELLLDRSSRLHQQDRRSERSILYLPHGGEICARAMLSRLSCPAVYG